MDLAAAITELKARGGDYLTDPRLTTFLNDAKNEFENFTQWPWLETTTTGTAPLTISDLKQVLYVVDTTNLQELSGVSAQFIVEDIDETIGTSGVPSVWWLDGSTTLKVYPTSTSASLSVRYVKFSPELTGTDTPLIPVRDHSLWVDLAVVRVLKDASDFPEAQALEADCQQRLAKLAEVYAVRNRQNSSTYIQLRSPAGDW